MFITPHTPFDWESYHSAMSIANNYAFPSLLRGPSIFLVRNRRLNNYTGAGVMGRIQSAQSRFYTHSERFNCEIVTCMDNIKISVATAVPFLNVGAPISETLTVTTPHFKTNLLVGPFCIGRWAIFLPFGMYCEY